MMRQLRAALKKTPLLFVYFRWLEVRRAFRAPPPPAKGPDGFPLPGRWAMMRIGNSPDWRHYYTSGARTAAAFLERVSSVGGDWRGAKSLLDFGCGCGRIARHVITETGAHVTGVDIDHPSVDWCARHLPGQFSPTQLSPPLPFASSRFDGAYAFSVFTHMSEPLQGQWWTELARVTKQNALLLLTFHDENHPGVAQIGMRREDVLAAGVVWNTRIGEGSNLTATFQTQASIAHGAKKAGFTVLEFHPDVANSGQTLAVLRRL